MKAAIGDLLAPLRIDSISAENMKAWAVFLRDPNPLHLDPQAVKAKGLGDRVLNQGPANLAYVISMLQKAFPGASIQALEARYVDNLFAGDSVEAGGRVKDVSNGKVLCEIWLRADGRAEIITGTAAVALP